MEPPRGSATNSSIVRSSGSASSTMYGFIAAARRAASRLRAARLGERRLGQQPGLEQLPVGRPGQCGSRASRSARGGRGRRCRPRGRPRPAAERDEPLDLEQAQALAERLAAHAVLLEHRRFGREPVAGSQLPDDDVVYDVAGHRSEVLSGRVRPPLGSMAMQLRPAELTASAAVGVRHRRQATRSSQAGRRNHREDLAHGSAASA